MHPASTAIVESAASGSFVDAGPTTRQPQLPWKSGSEGAPSGPCASNDASGEPPPSAPPSVPGASTPPSGLPPTQLPATHD